MGWFTTTKDQPTLRGKARDAASAKKDDLKDKAAKTAGRPNRCCVCKRAVGAITKGGNRGVGEWALCSRPACAKKAANL